MTMKEYMKKHYGDDSNCYPFDGNEKYVFMFVFDELNEPELLEKTVEMVGHSSHHPSEIFEQLMHNDKITCFSYYADNDTQHIKAFIEDENALMAYKLVDDCEKAFNVTIK